MDTLRRVDPVYPNRPACFSASTLSGLADFLLADVDGLFARHPRCLVTVESPQRVSVYSPIYGEDQKRDLLARCEISISDLHTDTYLDAEEFNVMLQARVVQSANRDLVLRFVGTMRDEQSNQTADDGFSQRVPVRTGVAQEGDVTIVNPVYLAPRRTFPEIDQPESPYILRLREGPQAALFRADDQAWRVGAIASIGAWLRDRLQAAPGCVVIA